MQKNLKYINHSIVFQEVPNEVTLAINISGCPVHCEGCHSKYLWEDTGNYITDDLPQLLETYKDKITCVCFMGGDHNRDCLEELKYLCYLCGEAGLKTALYTGRTIYSELIAFAIHYLDYLKVGEYISELGGLDNPNTNQRMFQMAVENDQNVFKDITSLFWHTDATVTTLSTTEMFKYAALANSQKIKRG